MSLDTPIIGTETGQEFSRAILGNEMALDIDQSRADIITAGGSSAPKTRTSAPWFWSAHGALRIRRV